MCAGSERGGREGQREGQREGEREGGREEGREGGMGREKGIEGGRERGRRERGREGEREGGRERGRQVMKYCSVIEAVEVLSEKEVLEVWLVAPLHQSGHHCSRHGREHTSYSRALFSEGEFSGGNTGCFQGAIEGVFRGQ